MVEVATGTDELLCEITDRVATITLNKPHKKNALGDVLTPALRRTVAELEHDERVGCVVLTGTGDAFCAGGDVSGMGPSSAPAAEDKPTPQDRIADLVHKQVTLTQRIHELSKITIAALPGPAAGAGLSIALACDVRLASSNAFVTTAFKNIGLSGDYGSSWFLPRLIGLAKAKELFYTADRVDAEEGLRLGIFNKVFPQADFRREAFEYARGIANGPTQTLARMKTNLNEGVDQSLRDSLELEARQLISSMGSAEAKEAIAAFMEKRPPVFHS